MNKIDAMRTIITSVDELVEALGGTARAAEKLDVVPSAVSNWLAVGQIPRGHHLTLTLMVREAGFLIEPSVFGLTGKQSELFRQATSLDVRRSGQAA